MYIYSIGGLVIIENITDRNIQDFLRGHDMTITAMALSHSGFIPSYLKIKFL